MAFLNDIALFAKEFQMLALVRVVDLYQLPEVGLMFDFFVVTLARDFAILEADDGVSKRQEVHVMADKDARFILQFAHDDSFEDALFDALVEGGERVVKQDAIFIGVDGTGQADASFLPAAQIDAFLADFSLVTRG